MIKVVYQGKEYKLEEEMTVLQFIKKHLKINDINIIACKLFNEVKSLNHIIDRDCKLELLDTSSHDGNRIYVRGLTFVLIKAFEELHPGKKFYVNYSLGHSLFCEAQDFKFKQKDIDELKERMEQIVKKNIPFEKKIVTLEEAMELYKKSGREDKRGLLETRMKTHVSMYYCGKTFNYFYGVMPVSTKYLKVFDLQKYDDGLLLIYPRRFNPGHIDKLQKTKKLYSTFEEYDSIHKILGIETIAGLNRYIREGKDGELIRISEALQEKKIAQIADMIVSDKKKKIVLIAGPSSSGKTTFAQRLGIQLRVNGIRAVTLSMDNYFVERKNTPLDENGKPDFECLEAVDVKLFNQQLKDLLAGKEVKLPTFDFTDGTRKYLGNTEKLGKNEVIVIEGIHGLNEKLTKEIPRENKFKIYISALTTLNIDDCNRVTTTDTRLIRRMVRDSRFRSHSPQKTIAMWESVRRGEEKYIFPYQEDADVMFNSSLVYELSALKLYVEPLLASVDYNSNEFSEAKRLYEFLSYFVPIDPRQIPNNSIIREFIGDGVFYR
ncbi:MAG: nucleoside kinase [Clostridia bacterium]|nr:nucleoside kinase [Clostridia bacterium]